jgi:hypothetical protein
MKKIFSALALAVLATSSFAQVTAIAEVDYHRYNGTSDRSTYWATGLSYGGKYGTIDGYAQGVRASGPGYVDNLNGFEVGYTTPVITLGKVTLLPRLALGDMRNIEQPDGTAATGHYALGSVEAGFPLCKAANGYVSVSHMKGLNKYGIASQNRVQFGVDVTLTEKVTARVGYSRIWQYGTTQQGVVTMLFYSF